jgi:hypothetical protein
MALVIIRALAARFAVAPGDDTCPVLPSASRELVLMVVSDLLG